MGKAITVYKPIRQTQKAVVELYNLETKMESWFTIKYEFLLVPSYLQIVTFRILIAFASFLSATFFIQGQGVGEKLRAELIAMRDRDQQARDGCDKGTPDERMKCFANLLDEVDKPNTKRINEIYNKIGFPDASKVGKDGLEAFLLILQHSNDIELKQKCLSAITKSFEAKQISASEYANFTDRLLFNLGKPQIYGCNFEFKDGKLVMSKTEDLKNLDERRRKIGLMPIAEYAKILKDVYKIDVVVPELQ